MMKTAGIRGEADITREEAKVALEELRYIVTYLYPDEHEDEVYRLFETIKEFIESGRDEGGEKPWMNL